MLMKKILNELPMIGFGGGVAVAGASVVVIGLGAVKKDVITSGFTMAVGAFFAHFGTQVTIGAIERVRGLR